MRKIKKEELVEGQRVWYKGKETYISWVGTVYGEKNIAVHIQNQTHVVEESEENERYVFQKAYFTDHDSPVDKWYHYSELKVNPKLKYQNIYDIEDKVEKYEKKLLKQKI